MHIARRLGCIAGLLAALAGVPAGAESFASSASSAGSASIGSLSDSVRGSSRSSSGDTKVAEGDYRVVAVTTLVEQPDMLTLRLQALAQPGDSGALWLTLPRQALGRVGLAAGDIVQARHRPYGVEFARAEASRGAAAREPFFLALADDWRRELDPRPLVR